MGDRLWHAFGTRTDHAHPSQSHLVSPTITTTDRRGNGAAPHTQRNANRSLQRAHTDTQMHNMIPKMPRLARLSSYIGLGPTTKDQSTTTSTFPELRAQKSDPAFKSWDACNDKSTGSAQTGHATGNSYAYNESDRTWHNPSLQQMMETVGSAIMTNGTSEPVPRHLNGFIAAMIEEFGIHLSQTKALQKKYDQLQATRKKETQEYASMVQEWEARQAAFKAEINRLEHIIARTQNGAESVMLARAGSVCNRNDAREFKNKLDRLSITKENKELEVSIEGSASAAIAAENGSYKTIGERTRILLDHNSDVILSEQLRSQDTTPTQVKRVNIEHQVRQQRANVADQESNIAGAKPPASEQPQLRKSDSSMTTACSVTTASSPSASLIAQGLLAHRVVQGPITPHTTPPGQHPATKQRGGGFEAIRELVKLNGGLPEQVVEEDDEDDCYGASFVPSRPTRRFSFDKQNPTTPEKPIASSSAHIRNEASGEGAQNDRPSTPCCDSPRRRNSAHSRALSSSKGSHKAKSALLLSMGRNLVEERKKGTRYLDQRGGGSPRRSDSPESSGSSRGTPTRKAQSGQDPFPDEATKYAYRHARLVTNAHIRATSSLMEEDLAGMAQMEARHPGVGYPMHRPVPPAQYRGGMHQRYVNQRVAAQRLAQHRAVYQHGGPHRALGHIRPPQGLEHVVAARRQVARLAPGYGNVVEQQQQVQIGNQPSVAATTALVTPEAEEPPKMEYDNEVPKELMIEPEAAHE